MNASVPATVTPATSRGTSAFLSPSEDLPCFRRETSPVPAPDADAAMPGDMTMEVEVSSTGVRNPSPPRRETWANRGEGEEEKEEEEEEEEEEEAMPLLLLSNIRLSMLVAFGQYNWLQQVLGTAGLEDVANWDLWRSVRGVMKNKA